MQWRQTLFCASVLLLATTARETAARPGPTHARWRMAAAAQSPADRLTTPPDVKEIDAREIDEVVKDYEKLTGLFTLYRRLESNRLKLYAEIKEEQLDRPFLLQATFGAGSSRLGTTAGTPINDLVVKFSRISDGRLLLVAPNIWRRATEGTPAAVAVGRDFPVSYLEIFEVAAKQAERQSLLIEISGLFQSALVWPAGREQQADFFDLNAALLDQYALDVEKSFVSSITNVTDHLVVAVQYHFRRGTKSAPSDDADTGKFDFVPDVGPRSLPLKVVYHLLPLPDQGYRSRLADSRVGYFVNGMPSVGRAGFETFDDRTRRDQRVFYLNRWRLEKADPQAPRSPPKQPIVFWIGRSVPVEHRATVREGILLWNRAFERLGFKDAIIVRQMPEDAHWDEADPRYSTVRWIASSSTEASTHAEAMVRENPLTGEILSASINLSSNFTSLAQAEVRNMIAPSRLSIQPPARRAGRCEYGKGLRFQGWFGLMALKLMPDKRVDERAYLSAMLREVVAHETGHALGLRHNFVASTFLDALSLGDAQTVAAVGVSASVMDYVPFNVFALSHPGVDFFSATIGPYDYWAIEYGYKPIAAETPEEELPELRRIAARCNEPGLAYQGDELADLYDPFIVRYDLGRDPLAFWEEHIRLNHRLIQSLGDRVPARGEDYSEFTRSLYGLIKAQWEYAHQIARYVGGLRTRRSDRGDQGELPQLVPLSAAEQQRALRLLNTYFFAEDALAIPREYFGRLAADPFVREDIEAESAFPLRNEIVRIQQDILLALLSPARFNRILSNEYKVSPPADTLTLQELFASTRQAIWAPLDKRASMTALERELQRTHLDVLILLASSFAPLPGDARLLAQHELRELGAKIAAGRTMSPDLYTRLHLEESLSRIGSALIK